VRAGYVDRSEDYIHSSYRAYYGEDIEVILSVTILEFGPEEGFVFAAG
jgi:hypothetical protein